MSSLTAQRFDLLFNLPAGVVPKAGVMALIGLHSRRISSDSLRNLRHAFSLPRGGVSKHLRDGIDPRWLTLMDRWNATATIEESSRQSIFYTAQKVDRWATKNCPDQTSPELWTRHTAAQFVGEASRLHGKSLLIECGDTRIQCRPQHFQWFTWVAENVLRFCFPGSAFYGHLGVVIVMAEDYIFRPLGGATNLLGKCRRHDPILLALPCEHLD